MERVTTPAPGPDGATGRELPASGSCENRACDRGVTGSRKGLEKNGFDKPAAKLPSESPRQIQRTPCSGREATLSEPRGGNVQRLDDGT